MYFKLSVHSNLVHSVVGEGFENLTREDIDEDLLHQMLNDEELIEMAAENTMAENSSDDDLHQELLFKVETVKDGL